MGTSSQSRRNNQVLTSSQQRDQDISQSELERNRDDRNAEDIRLNQTYGSAYGGYGQQQTGGLTDEEAARLRSLSGASAAATGGGGGGGGGGYEGQLAGAYGNIAGGGLLDMSRLQKTDQVWEDLMAGGFSPEEIASLGATNQNLKDLGKTGGIDPESMNRFRGNGGFDEMQKTGGMTDENMRNIRAGGAYEDFSKTGGLDTADKAMIRDRINSSIPATYDAMQRSVAQGNRVVGNAGGPGAAALQQRLGRDSAREIADVNSNAEMQLLDRIMSGKKWGAEGMTSSELALTDRMNQNKQWGTAGMSDAEDRLQGLRTGNILQGSQAAYGNEFGLYNQRNQNKVTGAEGWQENERYNTGLKISESARGLSGIEGLNSAAASRSAAGAASSAQAGRDALNDEWNILDFQNNNRQFGTQGMESMYNTSQNAYPQYADRILNTRSTDYANTSGNVQQMNDLNPSRMSQIQSGVGTAAQLAGAVGGVMSGVGSLGGRQPARNTGVVGGVNRGMNMAAQARY
jgi:hypothetical protein